MDLVRRVYRFGRDHLYERGILPLIPPGPSANTSIPHLKWAIRRFEIDTIIDVGANVGQFAHMIKSRVRFKGDLHCFEPDPRLIQQLSRLAVKEGGMTVHNKGLARESGTLSLNLQSMSTFNSFLPMAETGVDVGMRRDVATQAVEVTTLDSFLSGLAARNVLLKLDTQGFDLEVFAGLEQHAPRVKVILIETAFQHIYEGAPMFCDVLKAMEEKGYVFAGMPSTNMGYDIVIDADSLFFRKDALHPF